MMNKTIETKRFLKKLNVELLENSIKIKHKTLFDYIEYEVYYENIENKKTVIEEVNNGLVAISSVIFIVGLLYLFGSYYKIALPLMLFSIVLIITIFNTKQRIIRIKNSSGANIQMFFDKSNENEVRDFADEIISHTNSYLLNKYGKIDKDLPFENQFSNIEYLRNRNVINEEKYQQLKNQLLNKEGRTIGFNDLKK